MSFSVDGFSVDTPAKVKSTGVEGVVSDLSCPDGREWTVKLRLEDGTETEGYYTYELSVIKD